MKSAWRHNPTAGFLLAAMFLTPPGEALYKKEKYSEALKAFTEEQVGLKKSDPELQYNIANTHYRLKQYDQAAKAYADVAVSGRKDLAEKAVYNLGNTTYQQGKLEDAVGFYQKALELDPTDEDAKYNLEFVREEIKRRMNEEKKDPPPPQKQDQKKDQKQDDKKPGDQKDNQKKDQKKDENQSEPKPDQANQEQKPAEDKQQPGQEQKPSVAAQDAERMLQNLDEDRRKFDKKAAQLRGRRAPADKDW